MDGWLPQLVNILLGVLILYAVFLFAGMAGDLSEIRRLLEEEVGGQSE